MDIEYHLYGENNIDYKHYKSDAPPINFHMHDGCEIYFLISGDVKYFVEKKVYPIKYGDLVITNSDEIHKPSFYSDKFYERIVINFDPNMIRNFNTNDFDLLDCFVNRQKGECNKVSLSKNQLEEILRIFDKIENLEKDLSSGGSILKLSYFLELLVLINRIYRSAGPAADNANIPEKLIPVLEYIDNNLEGDLSLENLERKFFISRFYLCRIFKESIGANLHEYIVFKRIAKAKSLLMNGYSVTDACTGSGFNDYSNFIRTFKQLVGSPPGKYKRKYPGER